MKRITTFKVSLTILIVKACSLTCNENCAATLWGITPIVCNFRRQVWNEGNFFFFFFVYRKGVIWNFLFKTRHYQFLFVFVAPSLLICVGHGTKIVENFILKWFFKLNEDLISALKFISFWRFFIPNNAQACHPKDTVLC